MQTFRFMKNVPTHFPGLFYILLGKRVLPENVGNLRNELLQLLKLCEIIKAEGHN